MSEARYCWRFFLPALLVLFVPFVDEAPFVAEAAAFVELVRDWSPVELLVELESDWSPVVAFVLLVTDWSPVDVVLSMVRLERPRRSMFGAKVEVEPVTVFELSALDPLMDDWEVDEDPVTVAFVPAEAEAEVPFVDLAALVPASAPELVPAVEAWLSGMQSMWTALAEWSLAWPVALSASLPACGCPSVLHSGLDAVAALVAFVLLVLLVALDVVSLIALRVVCASTGVAARTAEAIRLRVKLGFMKFSSW